jgi:hypothetical protein
MHMPITYPALGSLYYPEHPSRSYILAYLSKPKPVLFLLNMHCIPSLLSNLYLPWLDQFIPIGFLDLSRLLCGYALIQLLKEREIERENDQTQLDGSSSCSNLSCRVFSS